MGLRWDTLAWGSCFTQRQRSTVNGRATPIPTSLVGRFSSCHGKGYSTPDFTICNFGGQEGGGREDGPRRSSVRPSVLRPFGVSGASRRQGHCPEVLARTTRDRTDVCMYV